MPGPLDRELEKVVSRPSWMLGFRECFFESGTTTTHLCSLAFPTKSSSLCNFVMSIVLRLSSIEATSAFSFVVPSDQRQEAKPPSLFLFLSHSSSLSSGRRVVAFPAAASRRLTTSVPAGTFCSMPSLVSLLKLPIFMTQTC